MDNCLVYVSNCFYIEITAYDYDPSCAPTCRNAGTEELLMPDLNEISKTLAGMPLEGLVAVIVLAAFGLAAYVIYAVLSVARGRR